MVACIDPDPLGVILRVLVAADTTVTVSPCPLDRDRVIPMVTTRALDQPRLDIRLLPRSLLICSNTHNGARILGQDQEDTMDPRAAAAAAAILLRAWNLAAPPPKHPVQGILDTASMRSAPDRL